MQLSTARRKFKLKLNDKTVDWFEHLDKAIHLVKNNAEYRKQYPVITDYKNNVLWKLSDNDK